MTLKTVINFFCFLKIKELLKIKLFVNNLFKKKVKLEAESGQKKSAATGSGIATLAVSVLF